MLFYFLYIKIENTLNRSFLKCMILSEKIDLIKLFNRGRKKAKNKLHY